MTVIEIILLITIVIVLFSAIIISRKKSLEITDKCKAAEYNLKEVTEEISELKDQQNILRKETEQLQKEKEDLDNEIAKLDNEKKLYEANRKHAVEMAEKELELEIVKKRGILDKEFERIQAEHPINEYQAQLSEVLGQIDKYKNTIKIIQQQQKQLDEKEDFVKMHSLPLTSVEKADIKMLKDFMPKLIYKDVLKKLIWSSYYQGKLQTLRKYLEVDGVTGIYKITNIKSNKIYIGQAIDIGDRWTSHVKCSLGIGVTTLNKFYTAMQEEGPESFTFELLEKCEKSKLNEREKYWIDFYNTVNFGYNTRS